MINLNENEKNMLNNIKFIDLFSGIGAFRIAFESFGAECVFSIDKDKHASLTYDKNFSTHSQGDICNIQVEDIPEHDILCAGFPCQSFSISGKQLGFDDMRGTLFFEIIRILQYHKPKIIFLENVSNLERHDHGNTFNVIKNNLDSLGYNVYYRVINASDYGIAQSRKRIYIVCIREDIDNRHFKFPKATNEDVALEDILIDENMDEFILNKEYVLDKEKLNTSRINKPIRVGTVNKGGQGDRIYSTKGHAITLSATGGGNGSNRSILC